MLVLVRELDDRFGWKQWSFKNCAEWLAYRTEIGLSAAREKVRIAHALRSLPAISAAFAEGRLSYSKVRALTRVADLHQEDLLLAYALDTTAENVEERCRQMRNVAPESVHSARRAFAGRSLTAWRNEKRGVLRLTLEVPIEEGELILRAIDCAVAAGEVTTDIDPSTGADSRSTAWCAQQADAFVAVARSYLEGGHGSEGGSTADHYQVVVHADAKSLRGGTGCSDLPIETVKRLLCDCSFVTVFEDENGKPLDVGRKQRTVSTSLRRALYARDRCCTFPGCRRKRYLAGHHIDHWINGGETTPANLALLCSYHHTLLHEGAFSIVKEADETLRFVTADGRTIPKHGYRREDLVDGYAGGEPSAEGFCASAVQSSFERTEVRETAPVYRVKRIASIARYGVAASSLVVGGDADEGAVGAAYDVVLRRRGGQREGRYAVRTEAVEVEVGVERHELAVLAELCSAGICGTQVDVRPAPRVDGRDARFLESLGQGMPAALPLMQLEAHRADVANGACDARALDVAGERRNRE
jgi:hypothetical protein